MKLTDLWGIDFLEPVGQYIVSDEKCHVPGALGRVRVIIDTPPYRLPLDEFNIANIFIKEDNQLCPISGAWKAYERACMRRRPYKSPILFAQYPVTDGSNYRTFFSFITLNP